MEVMAIAHNKIATKIAELRTKQTLCSKLLSASRYDFQLGDLLQIYIKKKSRNDVHLFRF